jgi:cysteinyl-tRNA synthetase
MRLHNTLTRQEEPFAPGDGETVRMYACGLTVYARGHVGNFRTFVAIDLLRRTLKYLGYKVHEVMNFTDVDDRTILESQKAGVPLREYTDRFIAAFREDAASLGLEPVEDNPRATDEANLRAMCDMIAALERNGHTYRSEGSIYFKISTLPTYGALAHLDHDGIKPGARIDSDKYDKENARDFVLWKATKEGEPSWDYGIGPGRPGWHIECSAMALRLLGQPPIDLHAGGVDLIFPHHENEIAQAEGATNRPFVRTWFHVEHLLMDDGEKMSKSVGNVFTVQDVIGHGHRASAVRFLLLSVHYRKQLKFSWANLQQAEEALKRVTDFVGRVERIRDSAGTAGDNAGGNGSRAAAKPELQDKLASATHKFTSALESDLNVPGSLGVLFELLRDVNAAIDAGDVGPADARAILDSFERFDSVLGVIALRRQEDAQPPVPVDEIDRLIEERQAARRRRDFAHADVIRQQLDARGIILEDSAAGTRWKRK